MYNQSISLQTPLTVTDVVHTKCCQKKLSSNIEYFQFTCLLNKSSLADKARLLSVSAPHSSSWLSMIPTSGQCLHLDPEECTRVCNRLSGYSGYSDIRKNLSVRIVI